MKLFVSALTLCAAMLVSNHGQAQTVAAQKAVIVANPMATSAPGATPTTAPPTANLANKPANKPATSTTGMAGETAGMVWVNTASNVYHCAGTRYYGKTKAGLYMTPAEARAKGNHPNKGCP